MTLTDEQLQALEGHTPGDWVADKLGVVTGGVHQCTSICETHVVKFSAAYMDQEGVVLQAKANAALIAAAPDLLAEVKRLSGLVDQLKVARDKMLDDCQHCNALLVARAERDKHFIRHDALTDQRDKLAEALRNIKGLLERPGFVFTAHIPKKNMAATMIIGACIEEVDLALEEVTE